MRLLGLFECMFERAAFGLRDLAFAEELVRRRLREINDAGPSLTKSVVKGGSACATKRRVTLLANRAADAADIAESDDFSGFVSWRGSTACKTGKLGFVRRSKLYLTRRGPCRFWCATHNHFIKANESLKAIPKLMFVGEVSSNHWFRIIPRVAFSDPVNPMFRSLSEHMSDQYHFPLLRSVLGGYDRCVA